MTRPLQEKLVLNDVSFGKGHCDKTLNKHAHVHGSEKRDLPFLSSRKVIGSTRGGLVKVPNRGHVHVC